MAERKKAMIRLDKFLTEMGRGTRSQVKEMVRKGRITVNGQAVRQADLKINPEADQICLDGAAVAYARTEYYMLNKPQGVVSATEDGRYQTVTELITGALRGDIFPVGRLDIDTEGLLLLTNDGSLAHNLLSPRKHVDKVYFARIEGQLPEDAVGRAAAGLVLEDGTKTLPARLEILEPGQVRLTIREGRFHQVKRMFEAMGCRVTYLKRLSMGPLVLDPALAPGEYRPLTEQEIQDLQGCQTGQKQV